MSTNSNSLSLHASDSNVAIIRNPLTICREVWVSDALAQMSEVRLTCPSIISFSPNQEELHANARSSCLVVVNDQNQPIGILTDRDVVRLGSHIANFRTCQVQDVMTSPAITLPESKLTNLLIAVHLLQSYRIRHLPLVDATGALTGIVTHETLRQASSPIDLLRLRQVREVMTSDVITAFPEDSITHVADLMAQNRVSSIVIVEPLETSQGNRATDKPDRGVSVKPIGLLTERDIVQFHALDLDPHWYTARFLMHETLAYVSPEDTLLTVREVMESTRLTCLMVTGKWGELISIITQSSLLELINPIELYRLNEMLGRRVHQLEADKMALLEARTSELEHQLEERVATLKIKAEREALMVELGKQIHTGLNVHDVIEVIVQELPVLLHCDRVMVGRLTIEDEVESLEVIDGSTAEDLEPSEVYLSLSDVGLDRTWVQRYTTGEQCVVMDSTSCERCPPLIDGLDAGMRAKVVIPIVVDKSLWGLLIVQAQQPRNWAVDELEFLDRLVVQIVIAIQQTMAYEQLQLELSERRQAEMGWHESERRYYSLAEAVPVGIFRVSLHGHIQYINQRCLALLELERSQIQRDTWLHRIHPGDRQRIQDAHAKTRINGTSFQEEYRLQYEHGTVRWVSVQVVPSFDELGQHQGYIGTIVDINERKQAELSLQVVNQALEDRVTARTKELQDLATLQSAIFDGTNYLIVATDPNGIILQMNTAAEQLLGYHSSEVIEQRSLVIFHDPEELATHAATFSTQLGKTINPGFEVLAIYAQHRDANECEFTYLSKAADRIPVSVSMTALFTHDQELLGFVAISKNLSERQKAEAELRRLSERLSLAVTAGKIGIWDWDIPNNHLGWNERMYELYGVSQDSVTNKYETWAKSLHPDDRDRCEQRINDAVAGKCEFEAEFRIIHPDGDIRYVQALSKTTRGANAQAVRMIGLNIDITDRKHSEQQLQVQAQRERLLRKISQRIRHSLDLQQIFEVATREILDYLNTDRVGIFQINEGYQSCNCQFIAESTSEACASSLSILREIPCIDIREHTEYANGVVQVIEDIDTASLSSQYHQILVTLGVRASLVVPLSLRDGDVWGCLYIHQCRDSRPWPVSDIRFTEQICGQLSIAIQQAKLFQQLQQQLVEQQLKEAALQQQLNAIEASVDGIAILQNNVFVYVNQAHVQLFGYHHAEDMLGKPWAMLYSDEEQARFAQDVLPVLSATGQWTGEAIAQFVNGEPFYEELSLTLIDNGDLICVCRNISDRKRNEQALQQANLQLARATRHKDEFLANMSHELRTPLNAILGMTEGLQEGMVGDLTDEQNKALQIVERGGRHLLELINDILDLAKIEAGHVDLCYTTAQISTLCQASTSFVRQQAMQKSIALNVQTPERDLNVRLDERRIRQVLINLLNNAVKFTPEGGTITLAVTVIDRDEATRLIHQSHHTQNQIPAADHVPDLSTTQSHLLPSPASWLQFRVTDTGIGIAPEDIDRLFQPFIQIDSALNRHYSGTGLGLALIKHITELHGGAVGVQSTVGVGSEFWLMIPLTIMAEAEAVMLPADQDPNQISTLPSDRPAPLILLAEDNTANILTMTNYLKAKGFRLIVAKDGQEAIDLTQSQMVDLILMDIQLPTIDGLEAMKRIRQNPNYATVPIVAVTALTMGGDRERCLAAGADEYLAKPVQLKKLVHTIQNLLNRLEDTA